MSVFRDFEIEWAGEKYTVLPTMRLLRSIESDGTSITNVIHQVSTGKPQASIMARIVAMVMQSGGAPVTDEEMYAELVNGDVEAILELYFSIIEAISPAPVDEKKPKAHAEK